MCVEQNGRRPTVPKISSPSKQFSPAVKRAQYFFFAHDPAVSFAVKKKPARISMTDACMCGKPASRAQPPANGALRVILTKNARQRYLFHHPQRHSAPPKSCLSLHLNWVVSFCLMPTEIGVIWLLRCGGPRTVCVLVVFVPSSPTTKKIRWVY